MYDKPVNRVISSKINDYAKFVDQCTSETSKDTTKMCDRLDKLMGNHTIQNGVMIDCEIDMARLMTALIGMMAESGEFAEVVKKKVFQNDTQFTSRRDFSHEKRVRRCVVVLGTGMQSPWLYPRRSDG